MLIKHKWISACPTVYRPLSLHIEPIPEDPAQSSPCIPKVVPTSCCRTSAPETNNICISLTFSYFPVTQFSLEPTMVIYILTSLEDEVCPCSHVKFSISQHSLLLCTLEPSVPSYFCCCLVTQLCLIFSRPHGL